MPRKRADERLEKCLTGITGLDEVLGGGLPRGRPTLVCGGAGCGKTVLAMSFLAHGALDCGEPGLFVSFEESVDDLMLNFAAFPFDLRKLMRQGTLAIRSVSPAPERFVEAGEYNLEGLFLQIQQAVDAVGAKRLVLDSVDALFGKFADGRTIRYELSSIFHRLRLAGLTLVATSERGADAITRHGIEAHLADCVILLDHRVRNQISMRRLRVMKYRGSSHGVDEYPFLIGANRLSVFPITSTRLSYEAPEERVSTGVAGLDQMLGGEGYYRGSTVLISGTAGAGKSTLAAQFAQATCQAGGKCLYLALEESAGQLVRNMGSVGIDLHRCLTQKKLVIRPGRATMYGLEEHLTAIQMLVDELAPDAVVIDPITNFTSIGDRRQVKSMLLRLLDYLKTRRATVVMTSLTPGSAVAEETETEVSSLADTWIVSAFERRKRTRNRRLYVLKSRGMAHSSAVAELRLSADGVSVRERREATEQSRDSQE
ncbi:MAG: circadian clock protein KaiC [Chitinivibrionales bacterium]|nr:circadian clock protein KaiC [Chitinivibrionales bacterium]